MGFINEYSPDAPFANCNDKCEERIDLSNLIRYTNSIE